jgi:hypothetical protein
MLKTHALRVFLRRTRSRKSVCLIQFVLTAQSIRLHDQQDRFQYVFRTSHTNQFRFIYRESQSVRIPFRYSSWRIINFFSLSFVCFAFLIRFRVHHSRDPIELHGAQWTWHILPFTHRTYSSHASTPWPQRNIHAILYEHLHFTREELLEIYSVIPCC